MKKLFLFTTALIAASVTALAQPTLTSTTNSPVAGDTFKGLIDNTTGITQGPSGAGVVWDMTALSPEDSEVTNYLTCTASCDSFAAANLIMENSGDTSYINSNTANLSILGYNSSGNFLRLIDSLQMYTYPITYGNTSKDTATFFVDFGGGATDFTTLISTSKYDAYGSLKLPGGVFTNVVRIHSTIYTIDSADFFGFPSVDSSVSENYSWYVAGFHSPLLTVDLDTSLTGSLHVIGVEHYKGTGYSPNIPALSFNDAHVTSSFTVSPNPATSEVNFNFQLGNTAGAALSITDVTGRTVGTIPAADLHQGTNNITFPVSQLTPGMYIARLQTADGVQTHKFVVGR